MRKQSIILKPFIDFTCRFSFVSTKNEYRKNNVKGRMMKKPFNRSAVEFHNILQRFYFAFSLTKQSKRLIDF